MTETKQVKEPKSEAEKLKQERREIEQFYRFAVKYRKDIAEGTDKDIEAFYVKRTAEINARLIQLGEK